MSNQNDLVGKPLTGADGQKARSLSQRSGTSKVINEPHVDYPIGQTYVYRGNFYHPGDRIPEGMANYLRSKETSREATKELERLRKPSEAKVEVGDKEIPADDMDLPEGFPGYTALASNGITRVGDLKTYIYDLESLPGIGETTAGKIRKALKLVIKEEQ